MRNLKTNLIGDRPFQEIGHHRNIHLDNWRGISIIMVLTGHFVWDGHHFLSLGPFGVEMFFVLSGRLMAELLFFKKIEYGRFFWRRFSRIYPVLLVFVLTMILANLIFSSQFNFKPILSFAVLTFTYNYVAAMGDHTGAFDHIWSLCIEEHSYILLALIAFVAHRYRFNPLKPILMISLLSMSIGAFYSTYVFQDWASAYWRTEAHLGSIFSSAAVCLALKENTKFDEKPLQALFGISSIFAVIFNLDYFPDPIKYSLGTFFLALSINTIDTSFDALKYKSVFNHITAIGLSSYSIYIWQQPLFKYSSSKTFTISLTLMILSGMLGWLSYTAIEQPARKFLNRKYNLVCDKRSREINRLD